MNRFILISTFEEETSTMAQNYQCNNCGKYLSSPHSVWRHKKKSCKNSQRIAGASSSKPYDDRNIISPKYQQSKIGHGIKKTCVVKDDTTDYPAAKVRKTVPKTNDHEINEDDGNFRGRKDERGY